MPAPLPPHVARRAEEARLGRYLGALTPTRAHSLRTLTIGIVLAALVVAGWLRLQADSWLVTILLVLAAAVAVGLAVVGVIELLPGPGELLLFEEGFVHVFPDGDVDAMTYGGAPEGDELRARARQLMSEGA